MKIRPTCFAAALTAAVAMAVTAAPAQEAPALNAPETTPENGIMLLNADDAEFAAVRAARPPGINPEAFEHVVVFRNGVPRFDRGLAAVQELSVITMPNGDRKYVENGLVEDAWITEDTMTAVIARSRFVLERKVEAHRPADPDEDELVEAQVRLEWLDLEHPDGRWEVDLPEGRLVENVYVIEGGHGVAVMTSTTDNGDFRVFGRDRALLFEYDSLVPGAADIRATPSGGHLAVDLAFPQSAGLADRAIAVIDIVRGENWLYTWNYGAAREPLRWVLSDDGTLMVVTAKREITYGPAGKPMGSRKHRH